MHAAGGHDRLEVAAIATIVGLAAPAVAALGERSRLGRADLWAQAAETTAAALVPLAAFEAAPPGELQAAAKRFLTRRGRP